MSYNDISDLFSQYSKNAKNKHCKHLKELFHQAVIQLEEENSLEIPLEIKKCNKVKKRQ